MLLRFALASVGDFDYLVFWVAVLHSAGITASSKQCEVPMSVVTRDVVTTAIIPLLLQLLQLLLLVFASASLPLLRLS